jgi:hypothetical protein
MTDRKVQEQQQQHPSPNHNHAPIDAPASSTSLLMRTSLVGASVGLLTPLYVAAGVGWIWQTYKPSTFVGQAAKFVVGGVFLGAACFNGWTLFTQHLLPFVFNHAEIILPFALANAAVASAWYAIGESFFGLERMSGHTSIFNAFHKLLPVSSAPLSQTGGLPLGGPLVGLLTALTCFPLWQPLSQRLWPQELLNACDTSVLANVYLNFLPVGLGTGALVGLGLHFALAPVFTGRIVQVGGVSLASSLLLLLLALTLGYFYFCRFDYEAWEQRLNAEDGKMYWAHSATGEKVTTCEGLLDDTSAFLKGVALLCNMNSMTHRSHFSFVNQRLLADSLVAEFKSSARSQDASNAFEQSKSLLHIQYGIDIQRLKLLIVQYLKNEHDLEMANSVTDVRLKADLAKTIHYCLELQARLRRQIFALGTNADAEKAIGHLLSDTSALESRLIKECNQDFSKGSGTVTLFEALHAVVGGMAVQNTQTRNQIIGVGVFFVAGALFTLYGILKLFW